MSMPVQRLFLVLALAASAAPLFAGPPLITDDPATPGAGKWEVQFTF